MRRKSLVPKLIITLILTICSTFFVTAAVVSYLLQENYFKEKATQLESAGTLIERLVVSYINNDDNGKKELPIALNLISHSLDTEIILIDNFGYVYSVSNSEYEKIKFKKFESVDINVLKENKIIDGRSNGHYIYSIPIFDQEYFMGGVVFVTPLTLIRNSTSKIYSIIWISVLVAVIILSISLYYVSRKTIIKPLETINNAAKKLAKGDIGNRVEIFNNDEIGELAESFNTMAISLEEAEENRREFISNISHELRSPITSVKGFITAIIDGVIPKDKEEYYLTIANDEILRLTRLINDLLDLSTMQAGKIVFSFTEVDINHLVKTAAIKMQQKSAEKNIKIHVFLEDRSLYVMADNDRVIQVITNLLDNAIKYCHQDGEIKLITKTRGDKVVVSVYNNGPAISEDNLKYIWDRFYKADKSRTNKTSTGLGLSIVRNIIVQHGEDIWVENGSNGVGVTFSFTLPKK